MVVKQKNCAFGGQGTSKYIKLWEGVQMNSNCGGEEGPKSVQPATFKWYSPIKTETPQKIILHSIMCAYSIEPKSEVLYILFSEK